jgi:hypothetical protein
MLLLFFVCIPVALIVATIARGAFAGDALDTSRCATCGYALSGLADASRCPECGNPPRFRSTIPLPARYYLYMVLAAMSAPIVGGVLTHGALVVFGTFAWGIAVAALAVCIRVIDRELPPNHVRVLAIVILACVVLGSLLTIADCVAAQLNPSHGELGPGFREAIDVVLVGPVLTVNAALWLFSTVVVGFVIAHKRARRPQ